MQALLTGLLKSALTEALIKRLVIIALRALASSTKNDLDDQAVEAVAEALGVK